MALSTSVFTLHTLSFHSFDHPSRHSLPQISATGGSDSTSPSSTMRQVWYHIQLAALVTWCNNFSTMCFAVACGQQPMYENILCGHGYIDFRTQLEDAEWLGPSLELGTHCPPCLFRPQSQLLKYPPNAGSIHPLLLLRLPPPQLNISNLLGFANMTEYDYSPEAYEQHLATQLRISRWAEANSQYPAKNPFATPVASSVATSRPSTPHRYQRHLGLEASLPHGSPSIHSSDSRHTKNSRSTPHTPSSRSRSRSRAHAPHVESTPPPVPQKDSKTNLALKYRRQTPYYPDHPVPANATSHAPSSATQVAAEGQELGYIRSQPTLPEAPEANKYSRSHGAQSHSSSLSRSNLRRMQSQPFPSNDQGLPPIANIPYPPPYTETSTSWYRPRTKSQPDHLAKGKSQGSYPASPKLDLSGYTSPATYDPAGKPLASSPYTQMNPQGSYPVLPFQTNGYPCPTSLDMSAAVPGYTTVYPDPTRSTRIKSSSKHSTVVPINGGKDGYVVLPASRTRARVYINPPTEQKQELPLYQDEKQAHMYRMAPEVFEDNQVKPKKSKGLLGRLRGGFSSCADLSGKN